MTQIIGIDDAGRGPIIGPMVLAGVLIEESNNSELQEWGVKDSKKVPSEKRQELAKKISANFKYHVEITLPEEIDSRTKAGTNLNWIEALKTASIINTLVKQANSKQKIKIIVDCPSVNIESWSNYLKRYIEQPELIELSCEHKADVNHPAVSAASIIAKQTREDEIEKLKKELGIDFGSGYASDPFTQDFLEKRFSEFKDHPMIRKSWDTFTKAKAKNEQKKLDF